MQKPRISVVIPTGGRCTVVDAVESALRQVDVDVEVLVVVNSGKESLAEVRTRFSAEAGVRVLLDDSGGGVNASRQLGIVQASHDLIALLDDDDTWRPHKLTHQLAAIARLPHATDRWVAACGVNMARAGAPVGRAPRAFGPSFTRADAYLFMRSTPRDPLHALQTSALLFPKELAMRVPWRAEMRRHQDWDWLLRCQREAGALFLLAPHYDVEYAVAGVSSLTATTRLQESLDFAKEHLDDRRLLGDFLLTRPFDMAVQRNDLLTAVRLLRQALHHAKPGVWSSSRAALKCLSLLSRRSVVVRDRRG